MDPRDLSRRGAGALLPLAWALGGCNALIGLDDVNVTGAGTGVGTTDGGGDTTWPQGGGGTTMSEGGKTGTFTGGAGGTTGTLTGGGGSGGTTSQGGEGGDPPCALDGDCTPPQVCDAATGTCVAPTCDDEKKDGDETGPDCGGPMCPPCGDGLGCAAPKDCVSSVCEGTCQSPQCGDGVVNGADVCDDDNAAGGDGCSASCAIEPGYVCSGDAPSVCWVTCGDGLVVGVEQCDDGNSNGGDGCASGCQVEPLYQCRTLDPPGCTRQETRCKDGTDNDTDGVADAADPDCALPAYAPQVACASLWIYRSVNVPMDVPDNSPDGARSVVVVPDDIGVAHMGVLLHVTHPRDSDVVATLSPPFGQPRTLTNGNGGNGAGFANTVFDSTCMVSVTMGAPPFTGCFKPQSFFPNDGQSAKGTWTLEVEDKAAGQTGMLDAWALVICAQ